MAAGRAGPRRRSPACPRRCRRTDWPSSPAAVRPSGGDVRAYAGVALTAAAGAWTAAALGVALVVARPPDRAAARCGCTRAAPRGCWPRPAGALRQRVRQLTETRADAVDAQAAELRRIERDLHDGAQARLVALGHDPRRGRAAAGRATRRRPARCWPRPARRQRPALAELRDLVRGIHPPVLAERGLADAVRALALDCRAAASTVDGRPARPAAAAPVESAAYFAVAEALANAAKHGGADAGRRRPPARGRRAAHDRHRRRPRRRRPGRAAPGCAASRRRLATFDGTLAVHSPPGGPTVVTMELPCVLSSPKTSPSSGTA